VVRVTPGARRRLRVFATTQIACSFVLLAAAAMLVATLVRLQSARSGYDAGQVLVFDIPGSSTGALDGSRLAFYEQATSRIRQLPGVIGAAVGSTVPWRDAGTMPWLQFTVMAIRERAARNTRTHISGSSHRDCSASSVCR